ncbi:hypothetical protein ACS5PN_15925 [Roseateles sp. NT4]|uniref:hypothetical protein n=1 Tax=Roseateles sp. NT4 TaxID=3453715 RepID=UPI003EEDD90C
MRRIFTALALSVLGVAQAATVSVYATLADWQAAVSGPVQTQDFSGYALNTDLTGVQLLPGVTLSSNIGAVEAFNATDRRASAFGPQRAQGDGYYKGNYTLPYRAVALDIMSFEAVPGNGSTAVDEGVLDFLFSDGSSYSMNVAGLPVIGPIFIGIVSDVSIASFTWNEAHEASGGNEETGLDNLRVALAVNQLPLPGTLPLALLAMGVLPLVRGRRR